MKEANPFLIDQPCQFFIVEKRTCISTGGDPMGCWCYRNWILANKHMRNYGYIR